MKSIESRVEKIENKLNMDKKPLVLLVAFFGDGELPPESTQRGVTVRYVHYRDLPKDRGTDHLQSAKAN